MFASLQTPLTALLDSVVFIRMSSNPLDPKIQRAKAKEKKIDGNENKSGKSTPMEVDKSKVAVTAQISSGHKALSASSVVDAPKRTDKIEVSTPPNKKTGLSKIITEPKSVKDVAKPIIQPKGAINIKIGAANAPSAIGDAPKAVVSKPEATKNAAKVPQKPERVAYRDKIRARKRKTLLTKAVLKRQKYLRTKQLMMKRAQKYLHEYRKDERRIINLKRAAKKAGNFYVPDEPRFAVIIRIRGINGLHPKPRKVLQLFRLRQINNACFLKLNKASLNMLRLIDPYVAWGYPSLKLIRKMIYKRGFCKVAGSRLPLTNERIQRKLGKYGLICVEDLVHEIFTVGPHFKRVNSFLWPFKLNNPTGGWRKKGKHFVEGGDFGNRENYINRLMETMAIKWFPVINFYLRTISVTVL
ncbi:unnamed protein product [Protopolystoma xenopodis]|uniref:Large ribosomal subunit protein uL30 n=1 Tax=Protopolystoma xenopodis TaxID=117903 RepID=A0A448X052_9PLAT|nr:unnamed protein product [Protopolystoma xenopodis]